MDIALFDFDLPEDRIALRPAEPRGSARLLHVHGGGLTDAKVGDLDALLRPGDHLVFNDTKVIPARLYGKRGEASIEITLHMQKGPTVWEVFARPAKKLRDGDILTFGTVEAKVISVGDAGARTVQFDVAAEAMMPTLSEIGSMPLPPYIASKRAVDDRDTDDYQTILADKEGAVAAPTAGLHMTDAMLHALQTRGIDYSTVTLHVGAGTFLPVKADDTDDHVMHSEWGEISAETAARLNSVRKAGGRIVAVGTTSMRLLESAADDQGVLLPFSDTTDIFITPGYAFRGVDVLMTNFHLPKSTLFMLISAFSGRKRMLAAYRHAVDSHYRFYSYGDACLLECLDDIDEETSQSDLLQSGGTA